jgi:hypothetical protein
MTSLAATYLSRLELCSPPAAVRAALLAPEDWLPSWRRLRSLELQNPGDENGLGRRYRTRVRAFAPYELTWEMTLVRAEATTLAWDAVGDLHGHAHLTIGGRGASTEVVARWSVTPTPRWMRILWPVASRLFVRNHDAVMRDGAAHLAEHLDAELVRIEVGREGAH